MYIRGGARITSLIWYDRWAIVALAIMAVATEVIEPFLPETVLFSVTYIGVFSAAISIFLVFRFNEAYERWWEARKLWGTLVNVSRDFTRQVLTLIPGDPNSPVTRRLVYGQIAFVHALRIRLRQKSPEAGREEVGEVLARLMPDDRDSVVKRNNVPAAILQLQSERILAQLGDSTGGSVRFARFDRNLGQLFDVQGACERIKNTPFPENVTVITRMLVWGLALLLFLATVEPGGRDSWMTTVGVGIMAMGYIWIDSMGKLLKDPFENRPSDTPLTALSITIERDLREMIGDSDCPAMPEPKRGVLM